LVTEKSLSPLIRPYVEQDINYIFKWKVTKSFPLIF
jgi:hypothetical protein